MSRARNLAATALGLALFAHQVCRAESSPAAWASPADGGTSGSRWVEFAPPARAEHVAAYNERGNRLIVFGGRVDGVVRNDVWALSLTGRKSWSRLEPAGEIPPARSGAASAFDAVSERLLVFGGSDASLHYLNDLWELSLRGRPTWRRLTSGGELPPPRAHHTITFDPLNRRLLLYGGDQGYGSYFGDVWEFPLAGSAWRQVLPTGDLPFARAGHSAVYCPDLHGILVFGGERHSDLLTHEAEVVLSHETWLLDTAGEPKWVELTHRSTWLTSGVEGHSAVYDQVRHRMLVMGGGPRRYSVGNSFNAYLSLAVPSLVWSSVTLETAPPGRVYATATIAEAGRRMIVFGGEENFEGKQPASDAWSAELGDTLRWSRLLPEVPRLRFGARLSVIFDPLRDRLLAYLGSSVLEYSLHETSGWAEIAAFGTPPVNHGYASAIYDTKRDRMIVLGGVDFSTNPFTPWRDAWALSLGRNSTWQKLPTDPSSAPAGFGPAIYDPVRDRIVMFGSSSLPGYPPDSVWALPLQNPSRWEPLAGPVPGLPQSFDFSLAYDSRRDRILAYGGSVTGLDYAMTFADTWSLSLDQPVAWTKVVPGSQASPGGRTGCSAMYDRHEDRMIIVGGEGFSWSIFWLPGDVWQLAFPSNIWSPVNASNAPSPYWTAQNSVYDSRRSRTIVFQGDAMWALESGAHVDRDHRSVDEQAASAEPQDAAGLAPSRLALAGAWPNPSVAGLHVDFSLPDALPATLELLDVTGRRVWVREVGGLGPGAHVLAMEGARHLAPGIYLIRLTHGANSIARKIVRLE